MIEVHDPECTPTNKALRGKLPGRRLLAPLVLLLAVMLAYAPMFGQTDFVLDDQKNLVDNPYLAEITGASIAHFWSEPYIRLYIPVTYTAWSLLALLAGDPPPDSPAEARFLHITDLVLQAANTLLVFALLRCCGMPVWAAFGGALLFGIHPLQAEAVCWLTELKTLLAALFSFSAMLAFLKTAVSGTRIKAWAYLGSIILLLLGILAKPLAVCSLPMLFVLATVFQGVKPVRALKLLAPHGALCLLVILATMRAQPMPFFFAPPQWAQRLPVALDAAGFYLAKLLVPVHLAMDYGRSPAEVLRGFPANGYWALPLLAGAVLLFLKTRRNALLACLALFFLGILPVSGLVPFGYQFISTVADRYAYFAMLGPALAVAVLLPARPPKSLIAAAVLGAMLLLGLTHQQAGLWKQEKSLGRQAASLYPAGIFGLASFADKLAPSARTLELLRTHLAAYPLDPYNTSNYAQHLTRLEQAKKRIPTPNSRPEKIAGHFRQGVRLAQKGDERGAWSAFLQAVLADPDDAPSWNNLGCLLAASGYSSSEHCFIRALVLDPDNPYILNNAGLTLLVAGNSRQGLDLLQQAVRKSGTPVSKTIAANLARARQAADAQDYASAGLVYTPVLRHPGLQSD